MELRHLRYFLAVAEERNFTRAAEKLGISQPPLSQQIQALEAEIGVRLFHRVRQGVELTEAGEAFLAKTSLFPDQVEDAKRAAQRAARGEVGRLRISFTASAIFNLLVPRLIRGYRHRFPEIRLFLEEDATARQIDMLRKGEIDVAFLRPGPQALEGLKLVRFEDEPMLLVVPSVHRLAGRAAASLAEVREEPFVVLPRGAESCLYAEVTRCCLECGFLPKPTQEGPHMTSVIHLVAAGMGVSVVPQSVAAAVTIEGVAYVPISGAVPKAPMALASRRDNRLAAVRNFVVMAMKELRGDVPVPAF